jgi:RNA polymerase sigma-70 factor, ECF subfamily
MQLEEVKIEQADKTDTFAGIVEQYQAAIIRYLYRLTGDQETALDLAQETFVKAYQGIPKVPFELQLRPWLYRIATNNARQYFRRKALRSFISFSDFRISGAPDSGEFAENKDGETAVRETLRKIPTEQRTCLVLHYVEGFKYREIAEALGISEDAVRMRVSRAKEIFRRIYKRGEML